MPRPRMLLPFLTSKATSQDMGTADSSSGGYLELAQTFTVGVTGTLNRIEVQAVKFFGNDGDYIVSLYNTSGGLPTGAALAFRTKPWSYIPSTGFDFQVFDFSSSAIPVSAGTMMAFGVSGTPNGATGGIRSSSNISTYAGGEAKQRQVNPTGGWQGFVNSHDYGFKIYVDAAPTSNPGDFNNDGNVTATDYVVWRMHEGDATEGALGGNGDGANGVDIGDYNLWKANFDAGAIGSGTSAAVPEPTSAILLIVGAMIALTSRTARAGGELC